MKPNARTARMRNSRTRRFAGVEMLEARYVLHNSYWPLAASEFQQDWVDVSDITPLNKWQFVSSVIGYSGAGLVATAGIDPQTLLSEAGDELVSGNGVSVSSSGTGILALGGTLDVVAVRPAPVSATAKLNPYLVFHVNTTNVNDVRIRYNLRDLDNNNSAIQPFALQYRVGETGDFINLPAGFVADATEAGTTKVTAVDVTLPAAANNQPKVQIRIITCDAVGNDEWVGIDDIVISANRAPRITLPDEPATYTENTSAVLLQPQATIADADSPNFDTGVLRVAVLNASVNDRLGILHQGNDAGQIGLNGADISYGGVVIGSFAGGTGTTPLSVTLNAAATRTAVEALLRRVAFQTLGDSPSTTERSVTITLSDGDGGTSAVAPSAVQVVAVNDPATLILPATAVDYNAGSVALAVSPAASISDVDTTQFALATLALSITNAQAGDVLEVRHEGSGSGQIGVAGSTLSFGGIAIGTISTASGLTVTFNAAATIESLQQLLRNITYRNSLAAPLPGARAVSVVFTEGDGAAASANLQVNVLAAPVQVSVADASITEGLNGEQTLSFTVSLSMNPSSDVVVNYGTQDHTATTLDSDYTAKSGVLTFTPGGPLSQTIEIIVRGDSQFEPTEEFYLDLANVTNAVISDGRAVGTIQNDDALPSIAVSSPSVTEGNVGNSALSFVVQLSHASYQPITIHYATQNDTASNSDYATASGSLIFAPGEVTKTVMVTVAGDLLVEPAESLLLVATSAGGTDNATAQGSGTIVNDDLPPTVTLGLHAESDTGVPATPASLSDRITRDNTPGFVGASQSGATVRVYVDTDASGALTAGDALLGQSIAAAGGAWQVDVLSALADGVTRIFAVATDAVGNSSEVQSLLIAIDTQAPLANDVRITNQNDYPLLAAPGAGRRVTPLVSSITVQVADLPARTAPFSLTALDHAHAVAAGIVQLVGQHTGSVAIANLAFSAVGPGLDSIIASFDKPLPDDRYTLTIGGMHDLAGNALATTTFVFVVDSRPELGAWTNTAVTVDTNGNGSNEAGANGDITYVLSPAGAQVFAGNFALLPADIASGFDKFATYALVNGQHRFGIDVDSDGVADNDHGLFPATTGVTVLNIAGIPIAGRFDNVDTNGDEVGVFDGATWFFDTNHNFVIDDGDLSLATALRGSPLVGDFDGDSFDDLATFDGATFHFDLTRGARRGWDGVVDMQVAWSTPLTGAQPVTADFDRDGVDDVGVWLPAVGTQTNAQWHVILSGGIAIVVSSKAPGDAAHRVAIDPVSSRPAFIFTQGRDLKSQFGDVPGLPLAGNFDHTLVAQPGVPVGAYTNTAKPWDVDGDGVVAPADALLIINALNTFGTRVLTSSLRSASGPYYDVSGDRVLNPLDALLIINHLNDFGVGEGEEYFSAMPEPPDTVSAIADTASLPGWWIPFDLWLDDEQEEDLIGVLADAAMAAAT